MRHLDADNYHSKKKEIAIKAFLQSLPEKQTCLDLGAGKSPYRKYCGHLKYISQDFCQYDGRGDGKGIQASDFQLKVDIVSDAAAIPLPSGSQDNVLCTEVLEHVVDPVSVVKEIDRLLRPGGRVLITVPGTSLLHFSPYHYYTGFKKNFFERIFAESELSIVKIEKVGNIFTVMALYIWHINLFLSKKLFPKKPFIIFNIQMIFLSPFLLMLLAFKDRKYNNELIEAGWIVEGRKKVFQRKMAS